MRLAVPKKFKVLVAILFFFIVLGRTSTAETDTEYWSKYSLSIPVSDRVRLFVKPELRFDHNMGTFYYWKIYLGLQIHVRTFFDLAVYYAPKEKKSGNEWKFSNLGYIDGTLNFRCLNLKLRDRNRLEYSFDEEDLKYRNRITVAKPILLGNKPVALFIADEVFYHVNSSTLNENRGSVGVSIRAVSFFDAELSLMHRSTKKEEWQEAFVVVSDLKFNW